MTVIVLNTDDEHITLAADSQWTDETDLVVQITKILQLTKNSEVIGAIATAGDAKKGVMFEMVVAEALDKASDTQDPRMVLMEVCEQVGEDSIPDTLVVVRGRGFHIDEEGLVLEKTHWAIGSGALVAMGAMWTRRGTASRVATFGCKAAIALTAHCCGPIDVFEMERA